MPQDGATLSEFVRAWGAYLTNAERKPGGDLDAERTRLAAAQADAQERKNREADGELIGMAEAEAVFFDVARTARTAWMNWPSRVAPMLAATLGIDADPLRAALDEHVHQQLAELGEPDFEEARHG